MGIGIISKKEESQGQAFSFNDIIIWIFFQLNGPLKI